MMVAKCLFIFLFVGLSLASVDNNDLSDEPEQPVETDAPTTRGPMVGGWSTMDLSNLDHLEKVQKLTDFAVKSLNAKSNDLYHMTRMQIVGARRQLVAGLKYSITFYMGQTDCAKNRIRNEELTNERCPVSDKTEAKFNKCTVSIWEKPWENYTGLISDDCTMVTRQEAMQYAK